MEKAELKKELREKNLILRDSMDKDSVESKSEKIFKRILEMKEWKDSKTVYIYLSMRNEPDTDILIEEAYKAGKKVCAPKIFGKEMKYIEFKSKSELEPGKWGITEPKDTGIYEDGPGIVIVPGIVFGKNFCRIGFGAGYYDRFFDGHNEKDGFFLVATGYDYQLYEDVPCEDFDVFMDAVVTESNTLYR